MHILAHRGMWNSPTEQNTLVAFARAFDHGFGIETDVRDYGGRLVISHNPPAGNEPSLAESLALLQGRPLPVALNIKADGLAEGVRRDCLRHNVAAWFVFDMSVPDMRQQLLAGNPAYARMSEEEQTPPWETQCKGLWLDAFESLWYEAAFLEKLLERGRAVCVVSEELHQRDQRKQWAMLRPFSRRENLLLCTDKPDIAREFFSVSAV